MIHVETRGARWRRPIAGLAATALAAGALTFATSAAAAGATVYVDPGGIDSSTCGTKVQQCKSIQLGVDHAEDGDTVLVAPGTYTETVHIVGKNITLQGDGATIDGTGKDQDQDAVPGAYGVLWIGDNTDTVKVSGFIIKNPIEFPGADGLATTVALHNTDASGTVVLDDNKILGNAATSGVTSGQVGINGQDNVAATTISNTEISGVFQGIHLENGGPATIDGNVLHDLVPLQFNGDPLLYGGQGIVTVSNGSDSITDQIVHGNTLRDYAGIGVSFSGGYDNANCTEPSPQNPCDGSISGSITANTFDMKATDADTRPGSAIRLKAVLDGTTAVTLGGNTGQVIAPTRTVLEETSGDGTIAVTPTSVPNTIVPNPAPTLSVAPPPTVTTAEDPVHFTGTATNPTAGLAIAHARYDLRITATSGLLASQLVLEYKTGNGYETVPLSDDNGAIVGSIGPAGGVALPADGAPRVTDFRISVPSASAAASTLSVRTTLVEVSQGTGNPVLNNLATDTGTTTLVANSTPATPDVPVTVPFNSAGTAITLAPTDADDDTVTVTHTNPTHGVVTGTGTDLTYVPATGYAGTDQFSYSANDDKAGTSTGDVLITVAKASSALGTATFSPAAPTSVQVPTMTIPITSAGTVNGGIVTVTTGTTVRMATVSGGKVTVTLVKYSGGPHTITARFAGTATSAAASRTYTLNVTKAASTQKVVLSPTRITGATTNAKAIVTVSAGGANVNGGTVSISSSATPKIGSATVVGGKATIPLPRFGKAKHTWKFTYSGTTGAAASTITYVFTSY